MVRVAKSFLGRDPETVIESRDGLCRSGYALFALLVVSFLPSLPSTPCNRSRVYVILGDSLLTIANVVILNIQLFLPPSILRLLQIRPLKAHQECQLSLRFTK